MLPLRIRYIIERALAEDIGPYDPLYSCLGEKVGEAVIQVREDSVCSGAVLVEPVMTAVNPRITVSMNVQDGDPLTRGTTIASVKGSVRDILTGERVLLNFLQRLSGIATLTDKFVRRVSGTGVKICDTRKTTPGLRYMEKYAVRCGGGHNHRFSLGDGVLIKENTIKAFGSIEKAVTSVREQAHHLTKIEVEVENLEEFQKALLCGVDGVLLDNMSPIDVENAVRIGKGRVLLEVSGKITLGNVQEFAIPGVSIISSGLLTHSAPSVDFSLNLI